MDKIDKRKFEKLEKISTEFKTMDEGRSKINRRYYLRKNWGPFIEREGLDIDKYFPRSVAYNNIVQEAVTTAKQDSSPDDAIDYIIESSKSGNSASVLITNMKKELLNEGFVDIADMIRTNPRYRDLLVKNREEALEAQMEREEFDLRNIPDDMSMKKVESELEELYKEITTQKIKDKPTGKDLMNTMTLFSARPSELLTLKLDKGFVSGHLKQKDKDQDFRYMGFIPEEKAKTILEHIQDTYKGEEVRHIIYRYMKSNNYKIKPRDLRVIGAHYSTIQQRGKVKHENKRKALRHKQVGTGLMHYSVK